ncbi:MULTISPECIES: DUF7352 domain-containing protein [Gordonia]|uniref:DUF7352 domain-containing protein n=1 Tax=Gordonia TaxID=2053 RepID=UPI0025800202|nr:MULTISPECIES: hypothetical protein [Gordonia]
MTRPEPALTIHRKIVGIIDQQTFTVAGYVRRVLAAANPRVPALHDTGLDLWYEVYPTLTNSESVVTITIVGTGNQIPIGRIGDYIDTVVTPSGLVWHVYALVEETER